MYRSFANGDVFSDNERAISELYHYKSIVICGAGADLSSGSALGTILRRELPMPDDAATGGIPVQIQIPLDHSLESIKKEVFLNDAVKHLLFQMPEGRDGYALASYDAWANFVNTEQVWERFKAHPDVYHYQAIHLGGDDPQTRYKVKVHVGQYGYRGTTAFNRDIVIYRHEVARTWPEIDNIGEADARAPVLSLRIRYIQPKGLETAPELYLAQDVRDRYKQEGGDRVSILGSHAIWTR